MFRIIIALVWLALAFPCQAQMTTLGAGGTIKAGAVGPPVLTFVNTVTGGSNSTNTTTFTNANIGSTAGYTTRRIIVVIATSAFDGSVTGVTIGGITATIHVQTPGTNGAAAIVSADVPTGSTATIVITESNTVFATPVLGIYAVDDALMISTTPSTATGSIASATSLTSGSFTQSTGGFIIVGMGSNSGNFGGSGVSISGFTVNGFGGSGNSQGMLSRSSLPSSGSTTVTANWTTSNNEEMAVAAWR